MHEKCIHRKETYYKIKKAEREAAAMPPSFYGNGYFLWNIDFHA